VNESENNTTIVVESNHREPIEIAHNKAKELYPHVSSIDSNINRSIYFFVIGPNTEVQISEHVLRESSIQQTFIEWCNAENEQAQAKIYKVDIIKH
jgi:hypothetical protein